MRSNNAYNSFKHIQVPFEVYAKDVQEVDYLDKYQPLEAVLEDYWLSNAKDWTMQMVRKVIPRPAENRLAFPIPQGYATFKDQSATKFLYELYSVLKKNGINEPRLLINHALLQPAFTDFYPQPAFTIPSPHLDDVDLFVSKFERLWRWARDRTTINDVKLMAHKTTSPSFPWKTVAGIPYNRRDVVYGYSSDMTRALSLIRSDYSKIKKEYAMRTNSLFQRILEVCNEGLNVNNILEACLDCLLTNNVNGYRFNSMDPPLQEDPKYGDLLYSKERPFVIFRDEHLVTGTMNTKKLAEYGRKFNPSGFSWQLLRAINMSSFSTGLVHQVDAQLFLRPLEESVNGFLSDRPEIKAGYQHFLQLSLGKPLTFITGDRSKAEMTITSNWSYFLRCVPESHRKLFSFFMTHIKWTPIGPKIIEGLLSGIGWTTGMNVIVGLYEAMHTIAILTNSDVVTVTEAYVSSVIASRSFFVIGSFHVKLFLPTDDIPLVIAGELSPEHIQKVLGEQEVRKMNWDINKEGYTTFGMKVDKNGLRPDVASQYSKLFYLENPGYWVKDCFSIDCRLALVPNSKLIMDTLRRFYPSIDDQFFSRNGSQFLRDLSRYGVSVEEAFNIYSPKDRLLLSRFVSSDPIFAQQRIDSEYFRDVFNHLKKE